MSGYCGPCLKKQKYRVGLKCYDGKSFCDAHYLIETKGYVECPACLGKGWEHPNGKRNPKGKIKCPLCKGERAVEGI